MRIFLDANVLFSAAHQDKSRTRALFLLAKAGYCSLVSSPYAIDEAKRNLGRKYPERLTELDRLLTELTVCAEANPEFVGWAGAQSLPPKDAPILAAAVQAGANWLVTGDQTDFGKLFEQTLRGVEVLPPAVALTRLLAKASGVRRN